MPTLSPLLKLQLAPRENNKHGSESATRIEQRERISGQYRQRNPTALVLVVVNNLGRTPVTFRTS